MNTYHANPIEHAARYYDAQGAAAESQSVLHEQMMDSFIDAVRKGNRDEVMPYISIPNDAQSVTEWLFNESDETERAQLMQVLHLALCKDNAQAIHEASAKFVESVARKFADAYVLWRAE